MAVIVSSVMYRARWTDHSSFCSTLVQEQLGERRVLQNDVKALRLSRERDNANIHREIAKTDSPCASLGIDIEVTHSPRIISKKRSGPVQ